MSFDRRNIIPIGIIALILVTALGFPMASFAQSLFGNGYNARYYGPAPAELAVIRGLIMAMSLAFGLLLGWLMSPESREVRKIILLLVAGAAVLFAIGNGSALGWSLTTLLSIILFCGGVGYWIGRTVLKLGKVPTTFGSASWATIEEMDDCGLLDGRGIRLGLVLSDEEVERLSYPGDRHALIVAPTRSGKGTTQIVPNLLTHQGSTMVIDIKGENALITARARQEMGQEVLILDPWGVKRHAKLTPVLG